MLSSLLCCFFGCVLVVLFAYLIGFVWVGCVGADFGVYLFSLTWVGVFVIGRR